MRSIVRRDTGEVYHELLARLAKASGIDTPTREDLARFDKKRKKKTSNKDWEHPDDPDATIGKMIERSFAHCYDTGGMRRLHLRHRRNILKRQLIHVSGFNLGLVMSVAVQLNLHKSVPTLSRANSESDAIGLL